MKKLLALIILFVIAASVLSLMNYFKTSRSLITAPVSTPAENYDQGRVRSSEEANLKIGMTKEIAGLTVTLNDVIDDYRCGADALCPEFGGITVNVTLSSGEGTVTRNMASDEVPLEFNGYKISIPKMAPTKFADRAINKSDYEVTFLVSPKALETINENPGL